MFVHDFNYITPQYFRRNVKKIVFLEIDFQYLEVQNFDIPMKKWRELTEHLFSWMSLFNCNPLGFFNPLKTDVLLD